MGWNQSYWQGYNDAQHGITDSNGSSRYKEGQADFKKYQEEDRQRLNQQLQDEADRRSKRGLFG